MRGNAAGSGPSSQDTQPSRVISFCDDKRCLDLERTFFQVQLLPRQRQRLSAPHPSVDDENHAEAPGVSGWLVREAVRRGELHGIRSGKRLERHLLGSRHLSGIVDRESGPHQDS